MYIECDCVAKTGMGDLLTVTQREIEVSYKANFEGFVRCLK